MSSEHLIDPYEAYPAEERPTTHPNLQTDSAESIVLALAKSDPLAFVAVGLEPGPGALGAVVRGEKFPAILECVLCHGELPHGHTGACPWWRAEQYRRREEEKRK